jgi:PAS domain S-box-containing protein
MAATVVLGGLSLALSVHRADRKMRGELLQQAQLVAQAVNLDHVRSLSGSRDDAGTPGYQRLKAQLTAVRQADKTCRFVYLLGCRGDGELFFYVDSEPLDSADYLPPGDPYPEGAEAYRHVFSSREPVVVGPATDRWGTWVSALVPLVDSENGTLLAVLGMDVDTRDWRLALALRAAPSAVPVALLLVGALAVLFSWRSVEVSARPVLRRLLPSLVTMLILVFGLGGWLLLQQHRRHLDERLARISRRFEEGFRNTIQDSRQRQESIVWAMSHDSRIVQGFRDGNPGPSLEEWMPVLEGLRPEVGLSHLCLLDADGTRLRQVFPDASPWSEEAGCCAVVEAERNGHLISVLELTPEGVCWLHTVMPVVADGEVLGYLEAGIEVGDILRKLNARSEGHLALFLHKEFLHQREWEETMRRFGWEPEWNRFARDVLVFSSQGRLPDVFAPLPERASTTGTGSGGDGRYVAFGGTIWYHDTIPLRDTSEKEIGCLVAMGDVTAERTAFMRTMLFGGSCGGVLLVALLTFVVVLLRRTDAGIRAQQAELRDSANLLRTVMDHVPIGIAVNSIDPGVEFSYINENFLRFYRVSREALASPDSFWEAVYEDAAFREELKQRVLADCRSGDPGRMHWEDIPITRQGRGTTYICARNTQVPGSPLVVSTVWDVTERKMAEEALREAEQKYRLLVDYSQSIIYTIALDGTLTFVSPSWETTLGQSPEEIVGHDFRPLVHEEDRAACEELLRQTAETGAVQPGVEYRVFHKDGSVRWHRSVLTPIAADGQTPGMFVGNAVDITGRKMAEAERERLRDQLMQAQKMESVGRLAGGVAHDFNNMLQAILGYAEMALMDVEPEAPLRDEILEIQKVARRAADLTRQLLAFARKQTVAPQVLDLNETVADMTGMLRRLIGEDIVLAWLPGASLWPVKVDPTQIGMVLANLCVNARDAIAGTGRVSIETRNVVVDDSYLVRHPDVAVGAYVMLVVSDDGQGMDKETQAKIFEPFFTTKGVGKGTGLGLSTVHGIAMQNGGFVNVYSEVGGGATFRVYFPRHQGGDQVVPSPEKVPRELQGGEETILVVEDEADILKVCGEVLGRLGYTVLLADTPGTAIRLAEDHAGPIHLLITDVVLPDLDGRRLAERIGEIHPGIPCVYMSGYTADAIAHHGILEEGLAFLAKPFSTHDLAEMVRSALDGGQARHAGTSRSGQRRNRR